MKDAVLAFIDIFHRENGTSYDQDVKALKSVVGGAILPEDLDKGMAYFFSNNSCSTKRWFLHHTMS